MNHRDRITCCVRLGGFITRMPHDPGLAVIRNGASDLMVDVFGERRRHARSTMGVAERPIDATVEVEALFEMD